MFDSKYLGVCNTHTTFYLKKKYILVFDWDQRHIFVRASGG